MGKIPDVRVDNLNEVTRNTPILRDNSFLLNKIGSKKKKNQLYKIFINSCNLLML